MGKKLIYPEPLKSLIMQAYAGDQKVLDAVANGRYFPPDRWGEMQKVSSTELALSGDVQKLKKEDTVREQRRTIAFQYGVLLDCQGPIYDSRN
jgi:hypothetical protein